ncbi:hypothetical protein ACTFIZ_009947 [Dictyostelium cf. discoideum]
MINGEPSIPFNIERGVRQGDPLSSTLFVLVIEVLAANILNDPLIKGIPLNKPNSIFIKFLQYADDSSSISPSYKELDRILYHFDRFCKSTSSKINFDKSAIIEVNPHLITDRPHQSSLNIPICNTTERYLGFHFDSNGISRHLPSILKSIKSSIIQWKCNSNSLQTKKTIINSYTLSKLIYHSYLETFNDQDYKNIDETITWFMSAPSPSNSINNIGTSTTKNITKTTTLMCKNRNLKPMNEGGWGMWHIQYRQDAQKIWIFNRFLHLKSSTNAATYIKHWTLELNNPKSPFLIEIKSKWNSFKQSFNSSNHQPHNNKIFNPILIDNKPIEILYSDSTPDASQLIIYTNKHVLSATQTWTTTHMDIYSFTVQEPDITSTSHPYLKTYSSKPITLATPHSSFTTTLSPPSSILTSSMTTTYTDTIYQNVIQQENSNGLTETSISTLTEPKPTETTYPSYYISYGYGYANSYSTPPCHIQTELTLSKNESTTK